MDWRETFLHVLDDITAVGGVRRLASMSATPGGFILEAETARTDAPEESSGKAGSEGPSYLGFSAYRSGDHR